MEELIILAVVICAVWVWVHFSKKDAALWSDGNPITPTVDEVNAVKLDPVEESELQLNPTVNVILDEIEQNITERQAEQRKRTAPARIEYFKRKLALIQAAKELQKYAQDNNLPE